MPPKKRYWLMKSEPHKFSFEDLWKSKRKTTPWDGVRNYQARNLMRDDMRVGDGVLFYHSSCKEPGVAGLAQVASEPYPDPTQFDPKASYFDPKSTEENPRWILVDVQAVSKIAEPVTLARLREEPRLEEMMLLRKGSRLSVQPVTAAEWKVILGLAGVK